MTSELVAALVSSRRSAAIPEAQDLYGWLVGSWELEVRHYAGVDVRQRALTGEVNAGWVLDGRAVQDTWIMPRRTERAKAQPGFDMYGSTLRVWDATLQAWRITWTNPAGDHHEQQIGRRSGKDIVQLGVRANGTVTRWMFTDITPSAFHWLGHTLELDGVSWRLEGEFVAKRTPR